MTNDYLKISVYVAFCWAVVVLVFALMFSCAMIAHRFAVLVTGGW